MRTSFKLLGQIHNNEDKAKRWLERVKGQGFHGVRLFGETHWWGPPFFGLPPRQDFFNLKTKPGSGFRLTGEYKNATRRLIELLQEFDLIGEFSTLATLKGSGRGADPREDIIGWNSHALRATAEWFRELRKQYGSTNLLYETVNEHDAHAEKLPRSELRNQARRWKTRDLPGSLIGISHGGRWDFQYPVGDGPNEYTHINIHAPRQGKWWQPEDEITNLLKHGFPVYFNETMHYMSQEQWDEWIPQIPKWARLSTTDWVRLQQFWNLCLNKGISFCFHDFVGMATDPDMAETPAERAFREQFGEGNPPPPPPPPPPDDLTEGKLDLIYHVQGPESRQDITVKWPQNMMPLTLEGGTEKDAAPVATKGGGSLAVGENRGVYRGRFNIDFDEERYVESITVFHGLDRGDIVEMDTLIYGPNNERLVMRSDHKEVMGNYDAFQKYQVQLNKVKQLYVHITLRVNGKQMNPEHPRHWEVSARGHWGIEIETWKSEPDQGGGNGGVDPPPPPDPSSFYLDLNRAKLLKKELEIRQQYMIWAGVRDPEYAAHHCPQLLDKILHTSPQNLDLYAERGQALYDEAAKFVTRLDVEHKDYPGRSMVRKGYWKEFRERYDQHLDRADDLRALAQRDPIRQEKAYDSIKGWCQAHGA
jgi:hypothetical protein